MEPAKSDVEAETILILMDWVRNGEMPWHRAVMEFRKQFAVDLRYCYDNGLIAAVQGVDKQWIAMRTASYSRQRIRGNKPVIS